MLNEKSCTGHAIYERFEKSTVKCEKSEKTGKKYDATVILDDTGDGFVNFKMEF